MWVKICANTTAEDALHAAHCGADAVGFVFAPSKRQVTAAHVAVITPQLPASLERVGVFITHDFAEIDDVVRQAGLTAVQLHGALDEGLTQQLLARTGEPLHLIQTLAWAIDAPDAGSKLLAQLDRVASLGISTVLIDSRIQTPSGAASGGTGVSFNWRMAQPVFSAAPASLRLIVAGGLAPENVAEAVAILAPWGVDVASGVEAAPGRKDHERVEQFIRRARRQAPEGDRPDPMLRVVVEG